MEMDPAPSPAYHSSGWVRNSSSPTKYHRTPVPIGILGTNCIWSSHPLS